MQLIQLSTMTPFGLTTGLWIECSFPNFTYCSGYGGYRLSGLGPYAWPVHFEAPGYAHQWSGGATNRFEATLVQVTSGQDTRLDIALGPEGRIINVRPGGTDPEGWFATAYNAVTGDIVSGAVYHNPPVIGGLNTESIFIKYHPFRNGQAQPSCWYGVPRRGVHSRPVHHRSEGGADDRRS